MVDLIAMQIRRAVAANRGNALREHLDDIVKSRSFQIAIGVSPANEIEKFVLAEFFAGRHRDDLLRQDIERRGGDLRAVQAPRANRPHQCRAFDQFVARRGKQTPFRHSSHPVPGAADALQRHGDRARRADLANQVDRPHIDAQLKRRRGDDRPRFSALELAFGLEAQRTRETAVVGEHDAFAEPLFEMMRDALGQPPRVDENESRAMSFDQRRDAVIDLGPHLIARHRPQFIGGHLDSEIHFAMAAYLDDPGAIVGTM